MPYQSKDWKINDIIREDDLDHIEQGLQETSEIAENNSFAISEINNILNLTNTDSILKKYIEIDRKMMYNIINCSSILNFKMCFKRNRR